MHSSLWWTLSILLLATWIGAVPTNLAGGGGGSESGVGDLNKWWEQVSTSYPRYDNTTRILTGLQDAFPNIVKIYSVGKSVKGRDMWVINLRANVQKERQLLQPPMKIVANMHGDETVGRALVLMLAVDLIRKYTQNDSRAIQLLETTDIHLMPSVNPDGYEAAPEGSCNPDSFVTGRQNANQIDLNRDFPDQFKVRADDDEALTKNRQPETFMMMKFIATSDFVLSANLHGGSLVASYPYDSVPLRTEGRPDYRGSGVSSLSPDNDVFVYLAKLYASNHKTMSNPDFQCKGDKFPEGITNGANWYNVAGGMQDFNYVHSNCFEITLELSCCKFPAASTLPHEWEINKDSLYKFIEATHMGIRGLVKDENGKPVDGAKIIIEGIDHPVRTNERGEYWRLLVPGTYKVGVEAVRYKPTKMVEVVVGNTIYLGKPNILDFTLTEEPNAPRSNTPAASSSSFVGNFNFYIYSAIFLMAGVGEMF